MVVSKKNHVTRTYDITVTDGKINQDIKLNLLGDVDGSSKVNIGDTATLYAHVKGTKTLY